MDNSFRTVYLAGKITGDNLYAAKFQYAAKKLEGAGFVVINPAILPEGFEYNAYMRMTIAMLDECEAACFLPDWVDSKGAMMEYGRAAAKGKHIFMFEDWEKTVNGKMHVNNYHECNLYTNGKRRAASIV